MNKRRWGTVFSAVLTAALLTVSGALAGLSLTQQEIRVTFEDTRSTPEPMRETTAPVSRDTPTPIPFASDTPASEELRKAVPGSVVSFGVWSQTSAGDRTPLQWLVTEVSSSGGGRVLTLLSLRMIEARAYYEKYAKTTWEKSDLRAWLNKDIDFLYAFSREERASMVPYETEAGLEDLAWVPSPSEWARIDSGIRSALQTYTERGAYKASIYSDLLEGFWLRGEEKSSRAPYVPDVKGSPSEAEVDNHCGVRPMIRVFVRP